jgi:hypothetical protein
MAHRKMVTRRMNVACTRGAGRTVKRARGPVARPRGRRRRGPARRGPRRCQPAEVDGSGDASTCRRRCPRAEVDGDGRALDERHASTPGRDGLHNRRVAVEAFSVGRAARGDARPRYGRRLAARGGRRRFDEPPSAGRIPRAPRRTSPVVSGPGGGAGAPLKFPRVTPNPRRGRDGEFVRH